MQGINARNWEHRIQGYYQIVYPHKWGKLYFFPDPMALVFWSKNCVLYIAPQKRKQDVLIPNMVLILAYGLCIKSYEQLKQQQWYYKIITGNYYKIVIIYVFPNAGNQLSYAIQKPYFCLPGSSKSSYTSERRRREFKPDQFQLSTSIP